MEKPFTPEQRILHKVELVLENALNRINSDSLALDRDKAVYEVTEIQEVLELIRERLMKTGFYAEEEV